MTKRIKFFLILFTATIVVLLNGCSKDTITKSNQKLVTYNVQTAPKTIDQQLGTSLSEAQIDAMCLEGLLVLGPDNGNILPGVAKTWNVSKDGIVWTFNLRKDSVWSNGDPVTTHDFNFAYKRALEPKTASQYAYMFYNIKNAQQYNSGKIKDFSKVGIKVIDDYTFQITLNAPVPYFDQVVTNTVALPLNEKFFNTVKSQYALSADKMLYNGAYVIKSYIPNGKYVFEKNPKYWNAKNIKIDKINFLIVGNYNTAADMFKNGGLSMTAIKASQIPQFKDSKALHTIPNGGTLYLKFNTKNKFFKNRNIRLAVAMSINRGILCNEILKDGAIPAFSFVPPGINGGKVDGKNETFRQRYGNDLFTFNTNTAKELYKKGLEELGHKGSVNVKLLSANDTSSMKNCQFIQQQIFKNLGMNVVMDPNTFQGEISSLAQKNFEFAYTEWMPDYNDPATFLNLWVTNGGQNDTSWSNAQYDKYIKISESTGDNTIRMKVMHEAEVLLMKDMPVTPIFFDVNNTLIQPWLKDVCVMGVATGLSFNWAYIEK